MIILAGVNDLYQGLPAESVEKNLKKMYDLALSKNIKVVACTVLPYSMSTQDVRERMARVNDWIRRYSGERSLFFCDTFHALEDSAHLGNLASTPDGLHPDAEGYRKMGDAVTEVLEKALPS